MKLINLKILVLIFIVNMFFIFNIKYSNAILPHVMFVKKLTTVALQISKMYKDGITSEKATLLAIDILELKRLYYVTKGIKSRGLLNKVQEALTQISSLYDNFNTYQNLNKKEKSHFVSQYIEPTNNTFKNIKVYINNDSDFQNHTNAINNTINNFTIKIENIKDELFIKNKIVITSEKVKSPNFDFEIKSEKVKSPNFDFEIKSEKVKSPNFDFEIKSEKVKSPNFDFEIKIENISR